MKKTYQKLFFGTLSGFIAGLIIGIILFSINAFSKIVVKFGAPNEFIAFCIHMLASTIIGFLFGLIFFNKIKNLKNSILYASIFSLVFWLLATIIVKPIKFGGTFLEAFLNIFQSLNIFFGHIIFGVLMGVIFFFLVDKKIRKRIVKRFLTK